MTLTSTTDGFYTTPIKYSTASIPFSEEMIESLKKDITRNVFQERPILSLLEKRTREAEREMARNLESKLLWGVGTPTAPKKGLKQIIAEAYDEHTPKEEIEVHDETNIAAEAVKKRKEVRAEILADEVGDFLEGNDWEDGDRVTWAVSFHDTPDKTYHYVALRGGNRWFLTGRGASYDTDRLLEILVDLGLRGVFETHDW